MNDTDFAPRYPVTTGDFTTVEFGPTPSQTVGPFLHIGLPWPDGPDVVAPGTDGAITVTVTVSDGARTPVADALVEVWQANRDGVFEHPDDPRPQTDPAFRGFGRCPADATGTVRFTTVKPGALTGSDGETEAPHLNVSIFARGILNRLVTRLYFADEESANAADPVLAALPAPQRNKLIARATAEGYHLDIVVQDADPDGAETPFFHF
ncbi:protocatechuate 3,4-dioxygenase subunit alpha [Nocardia grenadensis]|uniref:protocatechuate 3,4-dioxygenase subunit alpha n=1 Tax=Nocardia grenadensis TaxID=931537 RepID=UPI0007A50A6D|nr:protocatechuate 3,4-dioxygenase subunit alpha [Nocardia grenadensis]